MALERDYEVISDNIRLISERKRDLSLMMAGQYREVLKVYESSAERIGFSASAEEAEWLFRRIWEDCPLCSEEFALFCLAFGERFGDRLTPLKSPFREEEQEDPEAVGKTVYMRNVYGDRAFRRFSSAIHGLKSVHSASYAAACEEVYYGRSSHVILPVYQSRDGFLITFRRMLKKYDLKITAACAVETDEGDAVLYGLAKKELPSHRGEYLDLSLVLSEGMSSAQFFPLCGLFGLQVRLINSMPLEYASDSLNKHELHVSFTCRNAELESFALFLDASHTRYEIEGIYNII